VPEQDPLSAGFYETSQVAVAQAGAGTTSVVTGVAGKKVYVTGYELTLDAAGTLKFTEVAGDLTGAFSMGGAAAPPLVAEANHPLLWTTVAGEDLKITTGTGKAQGIIRYFLA
jgi:hypothetical protein